jgi:hypothetical protein
VCFPAAINAADVLHAHGKGGPSFQLEKLGLVFNLTFVKMAGQAQTVNSSRKVTPNEPK